MRLVACIRDVLARRELVLFCRICLPLFARFMVCVCVVGFSAVNRQFGCGCCAETATSLATGDQPSSEWEEERQKSRAEELRSRSLRRSSPESMRRFLWPCDSTHGCAQRRDCGWLAKAHASARVDVPTVHFYLQCGPRSPTRAQVFCAHAWKCACPATDRDLECVSAVKKVNAWICAPRTTDHDPASAIPDKKRKSVTTVFLRTYCPVAIF